MNVLDKMELYDLLMSDDVVMSLKNNLDYLVDLISEINYMIGFDHMHPHHHLDVWEHTLLALSLSNKDFDVRLCLLFHDVGKPFSYQDGDVRHFKGHPEKSAEMSRIILKRLGFDDEYIDYMCYLIFNHDSIIDFNNDYDICLKMYEIQRCDALAHHPDKLDKRQKYLDKMYKKIMLKKKV